MDVAARSRGSEFTELQRGGSEAVSRRPRTQVPNALALRYEVRVLN